MNILALSRVDGEESACVSRFRESDRRPILEPRFAGEGARATWGQGRRSQNR
jgi:hypothetical protein